MRLWAAQEQEKAMILPSVLVLVLGGFGGSAALGSNSEAPSKQPQASSSPAKVSAAEIQKLIDQLGSEKFVERQAASKRLAEIGEPAWNALRKAAANSEELEVRRRAGRLADDIGKKTFIEIRRFGEGG